MIKMKTFTHLAKTSQPEAVQTPLTMAEVVSTKAELTTTTMHTAMVPNIAQKNCVGLQHQISLDKSIESAPIPTTTVEVKTEPNTHKDPMQNVTPFGKNAIEMSNISAIVIKREDSIPSQSSPTPTSRPPSILSNADVKREFLDDNSQMSAASDQSILNQGTFR